MNWRGGINIRFFTDKTVINDYLLIKIKDYRKLWEKGEDFSRWKEVFVDPGVYELTKGDSYSWEDSIDIGEFLDSLPSNHYFSADYPCDMNMQYAELFLEKSWNNAVKYCSHPQYIVVVQSILNNYLSFIEWFNKYNKLEITSGIMGLGNICRIMFCTEYVKHTLPYAFKHCSIKRIHIYGLAMRNIPFAYKLAEKYGINISIDSTKWTSAVNNHCRELANGKGYCTKGNRQQFFNEYMRVIQSRGIELE